MAVVVAVVAVVVVAVAVAIAGKPQICRRSRSAVSLTR
jgi:hypothetical protein